MEILILVVIGIVLILAATPMSFKLRYRPPKGWGAGECRWHLFHNEINIHPDYRFDQGLIEHELYHARGSILSNWVRSILYEFVDKFRYLEEVEAYRVQLKEYPKGVKGERIAKFAEYLKYNYNLPNKLTKDAVKRLTR